VIVSYLLKVAMLGSAWVMYLLLALSVVSIGVMIERTLFFRKGKGGDELSDALMELLERGDIEAAEGLLSRHTSIEARVFQQAFRWIDGGVEAFSLAVDGEMMRQKRELESGMTILGTLGNNAPFVGLLGTVIGVIVAFADLANGSSKVNMDKVMSGIAEALIATGVGLFVAIPAVVAYNVFQKQITDVEDNVSSMSKRICALLAAGEHVPPDPPDDAAVADEALPEPAPKVGLVGAVAPVPAPRAPEGRASHRPEPPVAEPSTPDLAPEPGAEE
jgi:biopolymer transport protein ExbB/biopolymer transport protein TolQ